MERRLSKCSELLLSPETVNAPGANAANHISNLTLFPEVFALGLTAAISGHKFHPRLQWKQEKGHWKRPHPTNVACASATTAFVISPCLGSTQRAAQCSLLPRRSRDLAESRRVSAQALLFSFTFVKLASCLYCGCSSVILFCD